MTKEDFLIISDLLTGYDLDELDKVEFFMGYERKSNTKIPDEWFAEAQLKELEAQPDWSSFRREAAKDILCALIQGIESFDTLYTIHHSVEMADALIAKLKEK